MEQIKIPCPTCQHEIVAMPMLLFQGKSFQCPNEICDTEISISTNSISTAKKAYTELQQLKN
jgi:hypothetical protein